MITEQTERTEAILPGRKKKLGLFVGRIADKTIVPLADVFEGIKTDFADRSCARKTLIACLKLKTPICIFLAVAIVVAGTYFFIKSDNTATAEMSLNYEQSANGLNPNSTRFNAYDIASQEVAKQTLAYSGIDPEKADINGMVNGISIRPTNARAFSKDDYFISTSFQITLKKPSSIKGISTHDLLNFLCKSYKDHLYSKYTENRSILDFDIDQFQDVEFLEIADLLDLKAQQIEKYLNTRVKQGKSFTEQESDETFKSLVQKVDDLREYDIAKYRAFIIEAGCSHDKVRYIKALSYTNLIKGLSYKKDMAAYLVHKSGIQMYNEAMISVVMIPSIDLAKNTYYMSKTKTAMDYMASQSDNYLATAQETAKEISVNQNTVNKMAAGANSNADIQKATNMITEIRQKFSELSRQIETVDKAYVKYKTKDYLTFKIENPSLMQKLQVTTLFELAAVLILGIYTVIWLKFRYFSGGSKE